MFVTYCENRGLSFEKASNKAPFPRLITLIISEIIAQSLNLMWKCALEVFEREKKT